MLAQMRETVFTLSTPRTTADRAQLHLCY